MNLQSPARSLLVITAIFVVLVGAVFAVTSNEVNRIRNDFCSYTAGAYRATRLLPQVPARILAEQNDLQHERQLGCLVYGRFQIPAVMKTSQSAGSTNRPPPASGPARPPFS